MTSRAGGSSGGKMAHALLVVAWYIQQTECCEDSDVENQSWQR